MMPWIILRLFIIVSFYTSLFKNLYSFAQLNCQSFFFVTVFRSILVNIEISVWKLSPDFTFSIELVNLSISKSSPISFRFFTLRIYKNFICITREFEVFDGLIWQIFVSCERIILLLKLRFCLVQCKGISSTWQLFF